MLAQRKTAALASLASVSDGNHFAIRDAFEQSGVPYYRGKDVVETFFIERSHPIFITEAAYRQPHMTRSHLQKGDVLLSIVGTIGELSLVMTNEPATCNCKLAILRPHSVSPEYLAIFLRSKFGRSQIERLTRGAVQKGVLLEDTDQIFVFRLSSSLEHSLEQRIRDLVTEAHVQFGVAEQQSSRAEKVLLQSLALEGWSPPEQLSYTARASEALAAGRLDAEHYQQKFYAAREDLMAAGARELIPVVDLLSFMTNGHTPLHHDLRVGEVPFLCAEHVTDFDIDYDSKKRIRTQHHSGELARTAFKNGDVLLTIKGRVGNAAIAENVTGPMNINQDVALLRFNGKLPTWFVVAFINSLFGKLQVERMSTGGINPFLGLYNVRKLEIPEFDRRTMLDIGNRTRRAIHEARQARHQARFLLDRAKRAVEIAIEQSEVAAMDYLDQSAQ